ncbi:hypothetical protein [Bythopirellula polymerisocia]|uniref:hypothetical protein n=1 Tax=Bythopirellula polymerisocia TaxID=2528003 RepID=UPI0011B50BA7|nr:hypothetical protein [Bythopirellula polymerisocia]
MNDLELLHRAADFRSVLGTSISGKILVTLAQEDPSAKLLMAIGASKLTFLGFSMAVDASPVRGALTAEVILTSAP